LNVTDFGALPESSVTFPDSSVTFPEWAVTLARNEGRFVLELTFF
jgi:hypothetical protein